MALGSKAVKFVIFAMILAIVLFSASRIFQVQSKILRTFRVVVRVFQGEVEVLEALPGKRTKFLGYVNEGEELVIVRTIGVGNRRRFNLFSYFIPKGVNLYKQRMEIIARTSDDIEFTRIFTQDGYNKYILRGLEKLFPVKYLDITIKEEGFDGIMRIPFLRGDIDISCKGIIYVNPHTSQDVDLQLYEIKVREHRIPDFILREFEAAFVEILSSGKQKVEITNMRYFDGGIEITFRGD